MCLLHFGSVSLCHDNLVTAMFKVLNCICKSEAHSQQMGVGCRFFEKSIRAIFELQMKHIDLTL